MGINPKRLRETSEAKKRLDKALLKYTHEQIAQAYGCTKQNIQNIEKRLEFGDVLTLKVYRRLCEILNEDGIIKNKKEEKNEKH